MLLLYIEIGLSVLLKINRIIKYGDSNFGQGYIYMSEGERRKEKVTKCQLHDSNITVSYGYWTLKLKRLHQLSPRVFYNGDNRLLKTLSSFSSLYEKDNYVLLLPRSF